MVETRSSGSKTSVLSTHHTSGIDSQAYFPATEAILVVLHAKDVAKFARQKLLRHLLKKLNGIFLVLVVREWDKLPTMK